MIPNWFPKTIDKSLAPNLYESAVTFLILNDLDPKVGCSSGRLVGAAVVDCISKAITVEQLEAEIGQTVSEGVDRKDLLMIVEGMLKTMGVEYLRGQASSLLIGNKAIVIDDPPMSRAIVDNRRTPSVTRSVQTADDELRATLRAITLQNKILLKVLSSNDRRSDTERLIEAIKGMPIPHVDVHVPAPIVNVSPQIEVSVPEQPINFSPIIDVGAPVVNVQPTIELPRIKTEMTETKIVRDPEGNMKGGLSVHTTEYETE